MAHVAMRTGGHNSLRSLQPLFWGLSGTFVLVAIVVGVIADVEPADAELATAAIVVLATLWLAHSWRVLWDDERGPRP